MIEVKDLAKTFRLNKKDSKKQKRLASVAESSDPREDGDEFHAVRSVSLHCGPGEVLGLLGPNGAGKTTTLRMLSTALTPSSGEVLINGVDVSKQPLLARRQIGFLSGKTGLYHRLTVRENVAYFGRLHGLTGDRLDAEIDRIFTMLDINSFADKKADDLSTGMTQRASIARTVIHDPKVIVFDEPTTGLDVMSAKTILEFIESYKGSRVPVIFSTHHLHEVEKLCDRVALINYGITQFDGSLEEFRALAPAGDLYDAFVSLVEQDNQQQHVEVA